MEHIVSLRDYDGTGLYDQLYTGDTVEDLNKALTAQYKGARTPSTGPNVLQPESLESTLRVVTVRQTQVVMWRDIPKEPAFNTVEEYNLNTNYGQDSGPFISEIETPEFQDTGYVRKQVLVKYLGNSGEVSLVAQLVRNAHGNVMALETIKKVAWLLIQMEKQLFFGDSVNISESFDGLIPQLLADPAANKSIFDGGNVLDLRNRVCNEDVMEDIALAIQHNNGVPTDMYLSPKANSDYTRGWYSRLRAPIPQEADGMTGFRSQGFRSTTGDFAFKPNIFLRAKGKAPTSPTSSNIGLTPVASVTATAVAATGVSQFTAADQGNYYYQVTAVNRRGESAAVASAVVSVLAGQEVQVDINPGVLAAAPNTIVAYRIYRTKVGATSASDALFIREIPRVSQNRSVSGAPSDVVIVPGVGNEEFTRFIDRNNDLPGTSQALLVMRNSDVMAFKQLAPMMRVPLAVQGPSTRWMNLIFGTPVLYDTRKVVLVKNISDIYQDRPQI